MPREPYLDFSGDLFPWKFKLSVELAEIDACPSSERPMMLWLRAACVFGLVFVILLFTFMMVVENTFFAYGNFLEIFPKVVIVWLVWKIWNEVRFFFAYWRRERLR